MPLYKIYSTTLPENDHKGSSFIEAYQEFNNLVDEGEVKDAILVRLCDHTLIAEYVQTPALP